MMLWETGGAGGTGTERSHLFRAGPNERNVFCKAEKNTGRKPLLRAHPKRKHMRK